MKIKLWGGRGSIPSPYTPQDLELKIRTLLNQFNEGSQSINDFLSSLRPSQLGGFGGNTACVEIQSPQHRLIIDGGSGIRPLGLELMQGPCGQGTGTVDLLMTHFHWDHLIGLPFFVPIFVPGNVINIYSVQPNTEQVFRHLFQKPYFPVPYEKLGATLNFIQIPPRELLEFSDLQVRSYQLDHPDPCWGFRVEHNSKVYSHCVDTECTRASREELGLDLPLYQDVDLMIFDAQYTLSEAMEKVDWGHASSPLGLDIAMRENIKKIVFIHHDPDASDEKIQNAIDQTAQYYESRQRASQKHNLGLHSIEWLFGCEGMEFIL